MVFCAPIGAIAAAAISVSSAGGGFLDIGGGWIAEWDAEVDPFIILEVNGITSEGVFLEKTAFYKQDFFENGPAVEITFRQVAPDAVPFIVIQEEEVHNNTGFDWAGFENVVGGDPDVKFDVARTAASGGPGPIGWAISPFEDAIFTSGDQVLRAFNGTVPEGGVWQAGIGQGSLWIDGSPNSSGPFSEFTLNEIPLMAVPSPGAIALLAMGGLVGRSRRRRNSPCSSIVTSK